MDVLFLIISAISAVLACKIIISVYSYYIIRKKLNRIPGPTALPIIGTLETRKLKGEGKNKLTKQLHVYFLSSMLLLNL